jgi:hypothetical protein
MARPAKGKLTPQQLREQREREIYLSCLFIDETQREPVPNMDLTFEEFYEQCVLS